MPLASLRNPRVEPPMADDAGRHDRTSDRRLARSSRRRANPEARRPMLAALGVLVIVACAALGAEVAARVDHRQGYLAVATYVPQGSVITTGDLAIVSAGLSEGVQAIPQADLRTVLGRRASEPLEPGSLLVADDLTTDVPLPVSDALVGTSLSTDQAPSGLDPGDVVIVVLSGNGTGSPVGTGDTSGSASSATSSSTGASASVSSSGRGATAGSAASTGVLAVGTVYALALPSANDPAGTSSDETVTLEVPRTDAEAVAAASAAGDVSLAEVSAKAGS
ncbi:MAG: SAF domain-containing protein [Acidimicrobiales bacterium]|jgi:hypothetical protein